jgi:hypothetical protein
LLADTFVSIVVEFPLHNIGFADKVKTGDGEF